MGTGHGRKPSADNHRQIAHQGNIDPLGFRGLGILSGGTNANAQQGMIEHKPGPDGQHDRHIKKRALIENDRPDDGNVG